MMSNDKEQSIDDAREIAIELYPDRTKVTGQVIRNTDGELIVKFSAEQFDDRSELSKVLAESEHPVTPVTIWANLTDTTDKVSKHLLQDGQSLLAWVRVKEEDGHFVTKTALFSLGVVAAATIVTRAVKHYKPR
jgi:hypothetical protein